MPPGQLERGISYTSGISMAEEDDRMETVSSPSIHGYHSQAAEPFSPSQALHHMASRPPSNTIPAAYSPLVPYSPSPSQFAAPSHLPTYRHSPSPAPDSFRTLREQHIATKSAWTVIPSTEGNRILEFCKSMSTVSEDGRIPCYNRETLFDEEWQAHMKDVHGVFLLWPQTWMRRIEVLDLDAFGGDIGACNEVIMEN